MGIFDRKDKPKAEAVDDESFRQRVDAFIKELKVPVDLLRYDRLRAIDGDGDSTYGECTSYNNIAELGVFMDMYRNRPSVAKLYYYISEDDEAVRLLFFLIGDDGAMTEYIHDHPFGEGEE